MNNPPLDEGLESSGSRFSAKQITIAVVLVVAVVFAIINHTPVETNFLFFTVEMPLWIGLVINFALGGAVGWFLCSRRNARRRAADA